MKKNGKLDKYWAWIYLSVLILALMGIVLYGVLWAIKNAPAVFPVIAMVTASAVIARMLLKKYTKHFDDERDYVLAFDEPHPSGGNAHVTLTKEQAVAWVHENISPEDYDGSDEDAVDVFMSIHYAYWEREKRGI